MRIITISGAHSGIGKTELAEHLLAALKNWSAIKVTVKRGGRCPRRTDCGTCGAITGRYDLISDEKIIKQEGTDTGRLKKAGARKVMWLRATKKGLKAGLKKALAALKNSEGVVIEGTTALKYIKPDLGIFIDDKRERRQAAKKARGSTDIIIDATERLNKKA